MNMDPEHSSGQPAAEIKLLGADDGAHQHKDSAEKTNLAQVMQVDLARSTVNEMRNFVKSGHKITLGFGKHAELRYGSELKRLKIRPSKYRQEIYESANPAPEDGCFQQEWLCAGTVSHCMKLEKENRAIEDDVAHRESKAKLKSKLAALDAAKDANRSTFSNENIVPYEGRKSKPFHNNSKLNNTRKPTNSLPSSPTRPAGSSSALQKPTSNPRAANPNASSTSAREARRFVLLHLLAIGPVSSDEIWNKTGCTSEDANQLLDSIAEPSANRSQWRLTPKRHKELDVWRFPYNREEDRQSAIDNAIHAFDKQRINPSDDIWQKLLPKEERGKGKTLSKLKLFPNNHRELLGSKLNGKSTSQPGSPDPSKMDKIDPMKHVGKIVKKIVKKDSKTGETKKVMDPPSKGKKKAEEPKAAKGKSIPKSDEYVHDSDDEDPMPVHPPQEPKGKGASNEAKSGQKRRAEDPPESHQTTGTSGSKKMKKDNHVAPKSGRNSTKVTANPATTSKDSRGIATPSKKPVNGTSKFPPADTRRSPAVSAAGRQGPQPSSGHTSSEDTPLINAKRNNDVANKSLGSSSPSKQVATATAKQDKPKSSQGLENAKKGAHKRSSDSLDVDANSERIAPASKRKKLESSSSTLSPQPSMLSTSSASPTMNLDVNRLSPKPKQGPNSTTKPSKTSKLDSSQPEDGKPSIANKQRPLHSSGDSQQPISSQRNEQLASSPRASDKGKLNGQKTSVSTGAYRASKDAHHGNSNESEDLEKMYYKELTDLYRTRFELGWSTLELNKTDRKELNDSRERVKRLADRLDDQGLYANEIDEEYQLKALFSVKPPKQAKVFFKNVHNDLCEAVDALSDEIAKASSPSEAQKEDLAKYDAELNDIYDLRQKAIEWIQKDAGDQIVRDVFGEEVPGTPLSKRQTIGQYRQYHKLLAKYKEFKQESKELESYPNLPKEREEEDTQKFRRLAQILREVRTGFDNIMREFNATPRGEVKARGEREDERPPVLSRHEADFDYCNNWAPGLACKKQRFYVYRRLGEKATPEEVEDLWKRLDNIKKCWVQVLRAYALDFGARKVGNYDDVEVTHVEDPAVPFS